MFTKILVALIFLAAFLAGWAANILYREPKGPNNPISQIKPRPLEKYTIDNLSKVKIESSKIEIGSVLKENKDFTSYEFSISFDPTLGNGEKKKVTGLINIPKGKGPFPTIVMFRGYVDKNQYTVGEGTQHAAEFFAQNGFVTIAPDFLGYGGSDPEPDDIFEARFQTYTTALVLLKSISSLEQFDGKNIFIWGHSNGGQIALTVLEITESSYPTVLWAPVSKPFPYSILYYTDDADDHGKKLRQELAKFEEDYDVELYSLANYLDRIKAPIQLHQGTADDAVPELWSDNLAKKLDLNLGVNYFLYPNADHNLAPGWETAVARNLAFFKAELTK